MKALDVMAMADIKIDTHVGIITIEGLRKQVSDAFHELLHRLLKIQRQRRAAVSAEDLSKVVQWQFEEVTETRFVLVSYSEKVNYKIEESYNANLSQMEFKDDVGVVYVIDFKNMVEYRKSDKEDKVTVLRKDILEAIPPTPLPADWVNMHQYENLRVVNLPATDDIYKNLEQRFIKEMSAGSHEHKLKLNSNNVKVNKIERIQNKILYQQYQAKKTQMLDKTNNLPVPIEQEIWHATDVNVIDGIKENGFNRTYSKNSSPRYGEGVYFSPNPAYSARCWLSYAGPCSKGYMFLASTLTGEFCQGSEGMRYLPPVDSRDPTVLYHSAVDNPRNPMEFIIFNDNQAYPAYLISYST